MAGVMVIVAIMGIMSTVAFQEYAQVLRRDNEAEMIFRAQEITRAIQRYRLDHGGVAPLEFEQLMEPGPKGNYYLRQLYEDPLVPDGKWGFLFVGPGNQIVDPNSEDGQGLMQNLQGGQGSFNQGQRAGSNSGGTSRGQSGSGLSQLGNDNNNNSGPGGSSGLTGPRGREGRSLFSGASEGSIGLPIAGVRTLCDDKPFREYNGQTEYDQWQFTYFDLENQQLPGGQRGRGGNNRNGAGGNNNGLGGLGNDNRGNSGSSGNSGGRGNTGLSNSGGGADDRNN